MSAIGATCLALASVTPLASQGAVDPNVAPSAAAMERAGNWTGATEMLGRYLATAPGDGRAWFQFGRMYLLAARDWHAKGHSGNPDGSLYLDLAALAFDHAIDLQIDSGRVYRGAVEMERGILTMEQGGWATVVASRRANPSTPLPGFVVELGANLVGSCPAGAVLIPGNQLESLATWVVLAEMGVRGDVFPLLPEMFSDDSLYRRQVMAQLRLAESQSQPPILASAAKRHTLCLTPFADSSLAGPVDWQVARLALVNSPSPAGTDDVLTITQLQRSNQQRPNAWTEAVTTIYLRAATRNIRLCGGLLSYLDDPALATCGR